MKLVNDCTLPETMRLFGLCRQTPAGEYTNVDVQNEKDYLDNHERLVAFLVKIRETAAYNIGTSHLSLNFLVLSIHAS